LFLFDVELNYAFSVLNLSLYLCFYEYWIKFPSEMTSQTDPTCMYAGIPLLEHFLTRLLPKKIKN